MTSVGNLGWKQNCCCRVPAYGKARRGKRDD